MKQRSIYGVMALGGVIGVIASFLETIEYQQLLADSHAILPCNLNSVFSCTNVLQAWQSKVFGFPNSLLCMLFFMTMVIVGLVGCTHGKLGAKLRLWLHGIALFFLGFAMWFMWESTFIIKALCILCLFCLSGLLMVNWAWVRTNIAIFPVSESVKSRLEKGIKEGTDIFIWLLLAMLVAFVMLMKFIK